MKQALVGTMLTVLVAAAGFAVFGLISADSTTAQGDGRNIPFVATRSTAGEYYAPTVGSPCGFPVETERYLTSSDQQIVIRNEIDSVIAIHTLSGAWETRDAGGFVCNATFAIAVEDAQFYTIYLGDERIVGFASPDVPQDPARPIEIAFYE